MKDKGKTGQDKTGQGRRSVYIYTHLFIYQNSE